VSVDLAELAHPTSTVLITQECQNGVLGESAVFPELAEIARKQMIPNAGRIAKAARAAGVPVVHCIAERRPDGMGSNTNARLFGAARKAPVSLLPGSPEVEVIPEIGLEDTDLVLRRLYGLGPWGTELDVTLRNLGARTVVGVGVSINVGLLSLVLDAVNAGYRFVLPRDAVAGVPEDYAAAVIDNTLSLVASVVTTDDLVEVWSR
jgi:biuret amidohydrolase